MKSKEKNKFRDVPIFNNIKEVIYNSVKLYRDNIAFVTKIKKENNKNIAIFLFFKSWLHFYFKSFLISSNKIGLNSPIGKGILYKIELKEVELASSIIINKVASGHLSLILFFSTPFIKILKIDPSS